MRKTETEPSCNSVPPPKKDVCLYAYMPMPFDFNEDNDKILVRQNVLGVYGRSTPRPWGESLTGRNV